MAQDRYNLVFSGETSPGADPRSVEKDLARLLDLCGTEAQSLFDGREHALKEGLDFESAMHYGQIFEEAGALCRIEAAPALEESPPDSPAPARPPLELLSRPQAVALLTLNEDVLFSPVSAPRISAAPRGLDLARREAGSVDFSGIAAVSLHAAETSLGPDYTLLLFAAGVRRPFAASARDVAFHRFPDVEAGSLALSLQNFLVFLANARPEILMDEDTLSFMTGGSGAGKEKGGASPAPTLLARATAMGRILASPECLDQARRRVGAGLAPPFCDAPPPSAALPPLEPVGAESGPLSNGPAPLDLMERPPASMGWRVLAAFHSLMFVLCLTVPLWIPVNLYTRQAYQKNPIQAFLAGDIAWNTAEKTVLALAFLPLLAVLLFVPQATGRTWGQALCGISVVRRDGSGARGTAPWIGRFTGALLSAALLPLAIIFYFAGRRTRSLADLLSRTRQVDADDRPAALWHLAPFALFFLVFNVSIGFEALRELVPESVRVWLEFVGLWIFIFFAYRYMRKSRPRTGG